MKHVNRLEFSGTRVPWDPADRYEWACDVMEFHKALLAAGCNATTPPWVIVVGKAGEVIRRREARK